jgi:quercetin dioxygenase-like cupin family protein
MVLVVVGLTAATVAVAAALGSSGTPLLRHAVTLVIGDRSDDIKTEAITPEGKRAHIKLDTKEPVNVVMQEITYDPGATSGWHHHPGFVLAAVKSGQFKFYEDLGEDGCTVHTFNPGDTFVESGDTPGNLRNETTAPAVVDATFVVPRRPGPQPKIRLEDGVRCGVDP